MRAFITALAALPLAAALAWAQDADAPEPEGEPASSLRDEALEAFAEPEPSEAAIEAAPDPQPRDDLSSEPGSVAVLRGLDKVTARTRDFEAPVGEAVEFGALEVTANYCRRTPPEEPPEVYAHLKIDDRRTDGFGAEIDGETVFSGWMFASSPALNALEHPVYDVWVLDCLD